MERVGSICHCAVSGGVPRRSLVVALIVGTVLNLINQGDAMLSGIPIDLAKLLLTYLVPYFVSTYAPSRTGCMRRGSPRLSLSRPW